MTQNKAMAILVVLAVNLPVPSAAQFGINLGSLGKSSASTATDKPADNGCKNGAKKGKRSAIFGQIAGAVGGNVLGNTSFGRFVPVSVFSSTITEAIACRLDPKEQEKAATATTTAVRGEKVGKTSAWTSDTRPGVTGTSTVTQKMASADGSRCMMVTDVIIVNGEETKADKKMCRKPGASGYALSA